jgi:hypothetical protein
MLCLSAPAGADEGGVSYWLPGLFGSFAAVPGEPGFEIPVIYYHASASASGSKNFIVEGRLGPFKVARLRLGPRDRLFLPGGQAEGIRQSQGLLGMERGEPRFGLEPVAHAGIAAQLGKLTGIFERPRKAGDNPIRVAWTRHQRQRRRSRAARNNMNCGVNRNT